MVVTIRISKQRKIFLPTVFVIPAIAIQILTITVARSTLCIAYTILYLEYYRVY